MIPDRPLLRVSEAGLIAWPDLPLRVAGRRIYRLCEQSIIPEVVIMRVGRAIYLRRGPFLSWLEGKSNDP